MRREKEFAGTLDEAKAEFPWAKAFFENKPERGGGYRCFENVCDMYHYAAPYLLEAITPCPNEAMHSLRCNDCGKSMGYVIRRDDNGDYICQECKAKEESHVRNSLESRPE